MKPSLVVACLLSLGLNGAVIAQDFPGMPKPTPEHQWLRKFVGHWDVVNKGIVAEGQPPVETKGSIESKMMGEFWVINRMKARMGNVAFSGMQSVGYDVKTKKYVGTWIDTTNGYMWKYTGFVEKSGTKLVLEADGPDMQDPNKTTKYRDAYEFKSKDEIIVTSSMQTADGKWVTFMTGTGKRKAKK